MQDKLHNSTLPLVKGKDATAALDALLADDKDLSDKLTKAITDADDAKQVYANYYAFNQRVDRMRPHQVLALNRGSLALVQPVLACGLLFALMFNRSPGRRAA